MGPLLGPRDPGGLLVDAQRLDAHQGDLRDLHRQVELPGEATIRDVLTAVLEPFIWDAPRTSWLCRGRSESQWVPIAEILTAWPPATHGSRLLVQDASARAFAEQSLLEVSCRPA